MLRYSDVKLAGLNAECGTVYHGRAVQKDISFIIYLTTIYAISSLILHISHCRNTVHLCNLDYIGGSRRVPGRGTCRGSVVIDHDHQI